MGDGPVTAAQLREQALATLEQASTQDELSDWHRDVLGRQGSLSQALRSIGQLPKEERRDAGQALNLLRQEFEEAFTTRQDRVRAVGPRRPAD